MKRALLIGINYVGTGSELLGCINDINNINNFIREDCAYTDIKVLTDINNQILSNIPTRSNIESNIKWLVSDCKEGDTLFFYYSGHGSRIKDDSNDESNNLDEVLVPLDYLDNSIITDDWLYDNLAMSLPQGVTLWAFTDCCHSGTLLDLEYNVQCNTKYLKGEIPVNYVYNYNEWSNNYNFSNEKSRESNGNIYLFSGCLDDQTSADAYINKKNQGAFTACFLDFIKNNSSKGIDNKLHFNNNTTKITHMLKEIDSRLIMHGFDQRSQLSLGKLKDLNKLVNF